MYARSTTVRGNPQQLDQGIAYVRDEVMPLVRGMDGCVGLSLLCDRDSGRCIVTTAWETEEARQASAEGVRASRTRAAEVFGAAEPEVRDWEIAVMHRMHEAHNGACTRVIWSRRSPDRMDDVLDTFRTTMLSRIEDLPGFCSVSLMIDRQDGRMATAVTYDDRDAMMRANDRAADLRQEAGRTLAMDITEVAEFELVLAHLRVPETV
jgi:heme-degrading monooxygenase HmoA